MGSSHLRQGPSGASSRQRQVWGAGSAPPPGAPHSCCSPADSHTTSPRRAFLLSRALHSLGAQTPLFWEPCSVRCLSTPPRPHTPLAPPSHLSVRSLHRSALLVASVPSATAVLGPGTPAGPLSSRCLPCGERDACGARRWTLRTGSLWMALRATETGTGGAVMGRDSWSTARPGAERGGSRAHHLQGCVLLRFAPQTRLLERRVAPQPPW